MRRKCATCPAVIFDRTWCPDCHAAAVARVHARDTPDVPEVSLLYGPYQPPPQRFRRPNSNGRRVLRKSTLMS